MNKKMEFYQVVEYFRVTDELMRKGDAVRVIMHELNVSEERASNAIEKLLKPFKLPGHGQTVFVEWRRVLGIINRTISDRKIVFYEDADSISHMELYKRIMALEPSDVMGATYCYYRDTRFASVYQERHPVQPAPDPNVEVFPFPGHESLYLANTKEELEEEYSQEHQDIMTRIYDLYQDAETEPEEAEEHKAWLLKELKDTYEAMKGRLGA